MGVNIGKDCVFFVNGCFSFMFIELDLIIFGDWVNIDDVSVVVYINICGKFDLNRFEIGDCCVLCIGSRFFSGVMMKNDSCFLEYILIMGGDVVEVNWIM